jgi:pyruvate, water dikinase
VLLQRPVGQVDEFRLTGKGEVRASGRAVGGKIAAGKVRVNNDVAQLGQFRPARCWWPTPRCPTGAR